ncbi:hypothetical protein PSTG_20039, partial [Puccinia striiformis f. sp. tritici PST-78]
MADNVIEGNQNGAPVVNPEMERITATILKSTIEAIPLLTMDNYSLWKDRVDNMLDLQNLNDSLTKNDGFLTSSQDTQLRAIIVAKLDSSVHINIINSENKKDARLIWKSIIKYFALAEGSNRAR